MIYRIKNDDENQTVKISDIVNIAKKLNSNVDKMGIEGNFFEIHFKNKPVEGTPLYGVEKNYQTLKECLRIGIEPDFIDNETKKYFKTKIPLVKQVMEDTNERVLNNYGLGTIDNYTAQNDENNEYLFLKELYELLHSIQRAKSV